MKKKLIISLGKHYGGAEKLIEYQLQNRNDYILVLDRNGEMIKKSRLKDSNVVVVENSICKFYKVCIDLLRVIENEDVSLIHSHGVVSNLVAIILKKVKNIKAITTIHSDIEYDFKGIKKYIYLKIEKYTLPYFNKVICVSNLLMSKLEERIDNINGTVIYNGVEPTKKIWNKNSKIDSMLNILVVGRLTEVKNHKLLIEALNRLNNKNIKFMCRVIGDGELKNDLVYLAHKYGLSSNVIFEGFKTDVREFMRKSDVLVMSSIMEGIPLVILEAFAEGLPVVASDVGGIKEIIEDQRNGILYSLNDINGLVTALINIADRKLNLCNITQNAKIDFDNKWSLNIMLEKYNEVYYSFK